MKRSFSPLHNKWHRRVEGQVRDLIHHHPEWFNKELHSFQQNFVNSLAKRIVGEIVADYQLAIKQNNMIAHCVHSDNSVSDRGCEQKPDDVSWMLSGNFLNGEVS